MAPARPALTVTAAAREPSSTVLGLAKLRLRVGVFSFAFEEAFGGATDPRVSGYVSTDKVWAISLEDEQLPWEQASSAGKGTTVVRKADSKRGTATIDRDKDGEIKIRWDEPEASTAGWFGRIMRRSALVLTHEITHMFGEPPRYRCHLGRILLKMAAILLRTGWSTWKQR